MTGFHYDRPTGAQLTDDQNNQMWDLRFEGCTADDECVHEPGAVHLPECPHNEEEYA